MCDYLQYHFVQFVPALRVVLALYSGRRTSLGRPAGHDIGVLPVLAAIMSVHLAKRISSGEQAVWFLLFGAFLIIEFHAIRKDRADIALHEDQRRKQQDGEFKETMQRAESILEIRNRGKQPGKPIKLREEFVSLRYSPGERPSFSLALFDYGNDVLSGVSMTIARTADPEWGKEGSKPILVGSLAPYVLTSTSASVTPRLDPKTGMDSFWIFLYAQNGMVDETLRFRQSAKVPGTLAYSVVLARRIVFRLLRELVMKEKELARSGWIPDEHKALRVLVIAPGPDRIKRSLCLMLCA